MSDCIGKDSDGLEKVSAELGKVPDGLRKLSADLGCRLDLVG